MKLNSLEEKYFKEITQLHGVSGFENEVAKYLLEEYKNLGLAIVKDNLGSIFGLKKSKNAFARKVLVIAHMDEVGFLVANILDNGMIKVNPIGGHNLNSLSCNRVILKTFDNRKIDGTIDCIAPHLLKDAGKVSKDDLLFDFGFKNKQAAIKFGIEIGNPIVCDGPFKYTYNEESIISKAIDNRYGCILGLDILHELINKDLPYDLYVGASVQEEVGCRGAITSANTIQPDLCIVLDCSPAKDSTHPTELGSIGNGVLIRYFDNSMIANRKLLEFQMDAVRKSRGKYQYFDSPGGTDAGAIHKALGGIPTLTHCICARSIHTPSSLMRIGDYIDAKNSLLVMLSELNNELIDEFKRKF